MVNGELLSISMVNIIMLQLETARMFCLYLHEMKSEYRENNETNNKLNRAGAVIPPQL